MILRQDDRSGLLIARSLLVRCARRSMRRWLLVGMVLAIAGHARAQSSEQLLKRIDELVKISDEQGLTEEQDAELVDLLDKYAAALEREGQGKPAQTPAASPAPDAAASPAPAASPQPGHHPPVAPPTNASPAPTPTPRRRGGATPTPSPAPGVTPEATPAPGTPPTPAPTPHSRPRGRKGGDAGGDAAAPHNGAAPPAAPGVAVEPTLNVNAENLLKPYREREYTFSMKDVSYKDLVEVFARMASLPVIGDAPQGTTSLVSSEKMDFDTALGRVQMLLFKHPDVYWLGLTPKGMLRIARFSDIKRDDLLPPDHIYPSLEAYRAAHLKLNDIALLLYAPETGSIGELEPIRDFMPDYMQIAQYSNQNALTIFGVVADIEKYLTLVEKFNKGIESPARVRIFTINHVTPSQALEALRQLIEGFDQVAGAPAPVRRAGQPSVGEAQARGIVAIPNDDRGTMLVYAMPAKIAEIEKFLSYVDVPLDIGQVNPVVVRLEHTDPADIIPLVQSVLDQSAPAVPGQPAAPRPKRGKRAAVQPPQPNEVAASASVADLTMVEWAPAHAIILLGKADRIDEAKALIARFDVPDESGNTTFVDVHHREPDDLATVVQNLVSPNAPGLIVQADVPGSRIALVGAPSDIAKAQHLIEKLDIDPITITPTIHSIRLVNTAPSSLIPVLTTWDSEGGNTAAAAPAPVPQPPPQGNKPRAPRARRSRAVAGGNKFQADDAQKMLYVICTDDEWTDRYEPLIKQLDEKLSMPIEQTLLSLKYISADEAMAAFEQLVPSAKNGGINGPTYMSVPNGVLVSGAPAGDLATLRGLLERIDIDRKAAGLEDHRIFEIKHADPQEVLTIVQGQYGDATTGAAPTPRRRAAAVTAQTGNGSGDVRFSLSGNRLWVWAAPRLLDEIAALIGELDSDVNGKQMKSYTFAPGTDVTTLAQTLTQFFPDSGTVSQPANPAAPAPGNRRRSRITPAAGASGSAVMFIPQPESWKIVVSAPADLFPEIESTIDMLRPDTTDKSELAVNFFPVDKGDAAILADMVSTIATLKLDEMIAKGIVRSSEGHVPTVNITADPAGKRIIVAAPAPLMPEVERLLHQFADGAGDAAVVRRVVLQKVAASEMAQTITAMLNGTASGGGPSRAAPGAARVRGGRRSRGDQPQPSAASVTTATTSMGVTVVSAPGDDALVLTGPLAEVDKVEGWIKQLDAEATGSKIMKTYANLAVDAEKLADEIMTMFDSAPPAEKKSESEGSWLDFDFGFGSMGGPRRGADISLTTDPDNGTMIVWAPPRVMTQIDEYIGLYTKGTIGIVDDAPLTRYELKHATDAFDAKYALKDLVDQESWKNKKKPVIDYMSTPPMLLIKHKDEEEVKRVIALIEQYVDKAPAKTMTVKTVSGVPVKQVADLLRARLGDTANITEPAAEDHETYMEVLHPTPRPEVHKCVLPAALARALGDVTAVAMSQTAPAPSPGPRRRHSAAAHNATSNGVAPSQISSNGALPSATTEELLKAMIQQRAETAQATPTAEAEEKVRIEIDPETNSLRFYGSPKAVADAEAELETVMKLFKDVKQGPDIRVITLKYLDPNVAAQVIDSMFNGAAAGVGGNAAARAQAQAIRQQQKAMQDAIKAAQTGNQNQPGNKQGGTEKEGGQGGKGRGGKEGEEGREGGKDETAEAPEQQQQLSGVQVFPYPTLHAIILKAPTELYPRIDRLLATIDRPTDKHSDYRFFKIEKMAASDVEAQLKVIFGVEQPAARGQRGPVRQPNRNQPGVDPAAAAVQEMLNAQMDLLASAEGGPTSTESILITSNDTTNTVLVRGPQKILDMAGDIIADIEAQPLQEISTETFILQYADATQVVQQLKDLFAPAARGGGGGRRGGNESGAAGSHPDDVNAIFVPDAASNSIIVRCQQKDLDKIKDAIARLDVPGAQQASKAETVELACGDAVNMAKLLESIYAAPQKAARGNQAGAASKNVQFSADATSNTIVFTAPKDVREEIRTHIASLDKSACEVVKPTFITVSKQSATLVAKVLEEAFAGGKRGSGRVKVTGDDASGRLVVTAPKEMLPQIQELAKQLDVEPNVMDIKVYKLKYARAADVLARMKEMVTTLMAQIRGTNTRIDPFSASAEERTNSIIVMGGPVTFALVERVLSQIDIEGAQPFEPKTLVMQLTKARATEVVNTINNLFRDRKDGVDPPHAEATPTTNTLSVRGTEAQLKEIQELINKLEAIDAADRLVEATIPLKHVQADETTEYVRGWFEERVKAMRNMNPQSVKPSDTTLAITADPTSNAINIMASADNVERIKGIVAGLDKEGAGLQQTRETKVYTLRYADPTAVNGAIANAFRPAKNATERDKVDAAIDATTSSVIVTASASNQERVARLMKELDIEQLNRRITYPMRSARASTVATLLKDMVNQSGRNKQGRPPVSVVPNDDLNMLVLSGTQQEIDEMMPLIEQLDQKSTENIHVVTLKNADPSGAVRSLQEMFSRKGQGAEQISISNPSGTQTLLIKAGEKEFADIQEVIKQIDVLPSDENRASKMFALKYVNADEMQAILEDSFRVPGQGGKGGAASLLGDTRIAAMPSSNALVVTGSPASIEKATALIAQLDVEIEDSGAQAKIIKLQKAIASAVEPTLTKLFVEGSGASAGKGAASKQKPVIVADDTTNSLIVRAAPADYNLIERLALSLDEEGGDLSTRFKIIQVASAYKVADLAGSLEQTLRATAAPTGEGRGGRQNEVSVEAIPVSNTLVLAGDPKQLAVAEALVDQLQKTGPKGGRRQIIVNTKNISAEEIKRLLDEMTEQNNSGGAGSSRRGGGSRPRSTQPRNNSGGGRNP